MYSIKRNHARGTVPISDVPITQLSTLLGHASVQTTMKYLDLELDLEVTASGFAGCQGTEGSVHHDAVSTEKDEAGHLRRAGLFGFRHHQPDSAFTPLDRWTVSKAAPIRAAR